MIRARIAGTRTTAASENPSDLNGTQKKGSSVIWFQSMKSGMPGVDWILVASILEDSSFRYMAMQ
jgi:hypothetical protein